MHLPKLQMIDHRNHILFGGYLLCLLLGFSSILFDWVTHSLSDEMHSHLVLIPVISMYLLWTSKREIKQEWTPSPVPSAGFFTLGTVASALAIFHGPHGPLLGQNDFIGAMLIGFVSFLLAGALLIYGIKVVKSIWFPLFFLYLMVPYPSDLQQFTEHGLQIASSTVLQWLFQISGTTYLREGTFFLLPSIGGIEVAPECSGIRSTYVLFITSMLAGYNFLHSNLLRTLLVVSSIVIGILRNGLRIFTIAMGSIHIDPEIINGPIHSQGGPPFFVLSMIPLLGLLYFFRRRETRKLLQSKV